MPLRCVVAGSPRAVLTAEGHTRELWTSQSQSDQKFTTNRLYTRLQRRQKCADQLPKTAIATQVTHSRNHPHKAGSIGLHYPSRVGKQSLKKILDRCHFLTRWRSSNAAALDEPHNLGQVPRNVYRRLFGAWKPKPQLKVGMALRLSLDAKEVKVGPKSGPDRSLRP
jgi:hypothetical protein